MDSRASRIKRMRRGVFSTARVLEESFERDSYQHRKAFITLTYRDGVVWSPKHITDTLKCYDSWARRRRIRLIYVWVAELQKRGAVHYHIVMWLPLGLTPPLPDKQGWWKHGSSNAKWVQSPIGYLAKYLSKGLEGRALPSGARIWGSGGLSALQRACRIWLLTPAWLKQFVPNDHQVRRADGGWWDLTTGIWYRTPWVLDGFGPAGPRLRWIGWTEEDIRIKGLKA